MNQRLLGDSLSRDLLDAITNILVPCGSPLCYDLTAIALAGGFGIVTGLMVLLVMSELGKGH